MAEKKRDYKSLNNFDFHSKILVAKANEIIKKYFPKENLQFVMIGKADDIRDKVAKYGKVTEKNIDEDSY